MVSSAMLPNQDIKRSRAGRYSRDPCVLRSESYDLCWPCVLDNWRASTCFG